MKKVVFVISVTTLLISSLYSQTFTIVSGWQNLGALNDINVTKTFSNNCIDTVWKYDTISNSWSAYSPKSTLRSIIDNSNDISLLTNIDNGSGFWVKANSSCNPSDNIADNNITNTKINIIYNWQNLAAKSDINVSNIFNKSFIDIVWRYDNISNSWSAYSPKSSIENLINNNNSISSLNTISKGSGFWLKASANCTIDTNQSTNIAYNPTTQKTLFPGHYPGMWSNEAAFAALKDDGSVVAWGVCNYGGCGLLNILNCGVKAIYSTLEAFAALKEDGSVVTWGRNVYGGYSASVTNKLKSGVKTIYSTISAFAALKEDGSVITWGGDGGDSSSVSDKLKSGVKTIYSTKTAFAALKNDGSVVTWGNAVDGGDSKIHNISTNSVLDVSDKLKSGVKAIYSTLEAFAALKDDGSVVTWGLVQFGGDDSNVSDKLKSGVKAIYSNYDTFAALKDDGSVVTWGGHYGFGDTKIYDKEGNTIGDVTNQLSSDVKTIYSTEAAFAALKDNGSVVTWGFATVGGSGKIYDIDGNLEGNVTDKLKSGVKAIYSNNYAFAALKDDGSVVTWGKMGYGGDSKIYGSDLIADVTDKLKSGVKTIYSTKTAFAALKNDGSVVTWGDAYGGGDSSNVADKLKSGVKAIYSTKDSFAALKEDGSVVTWGNVLDGGDSSSVSDKLKNGVIFISPSYTN